MKILNGTTEANKILNSLKKEIKERDITPILAVFVVGENKASKIYIENKKKKGLQIGINVKVFKFPPLVNQKTIIEKIKELNNSSAIDGIIVQLPLPESFNTDKIISTIDPKKDVDGFHKENLKLLERKIQEPYLYPVLPQAIYFILKKNRENLKESKVTALVNSDIFGRTLKMYFKRKGIKVKYLKEKKEERLKESDIIISAKGEIGLIKEADIKKGAALIDAGFNRDKSGNITGDIDRKSVERKASFLTPVPGGTGPLTVAFLLKNTYLANINND